MPRIAVFSRRIAMYTLAAVCLAAAEHPCHAQSSSASLSVSVNDTTGAALTDAEVILNNSETNQEQHATSGRTGNASFAFLKPGQYALKVSKTQFADVSVGNIVLNVGDDKHLRLVLRVGSANQTVSVDGSGLTINTTDGSVSTVIDRTFVANMPLNGRSFQDLLTLAPGVSQVPVNPQGGNGIGYSGEIVVNGQRTEANYFTVDGVSANTGAQAGNAVGSAGFAGSVPGETALGSTQSLVSIDALQEFRATTSTYSAEYGRTPGGQFSFTTRSGTKDFHGTAYDYLRNDAMDASNWFNDSLGQPKGRERQNDFGGTFGGPLALPHLDHVRRDTFFFASYEGLRLDSPQAATQLEVPDMALRQNAPAAIQSALNAFPVQNDGEDGLNDGLAYYVQTTSYPSKLDNTSVRIDHHFSDDWSIFGRWAYTPSSSTTYSGAVRNLTSTNIKSLTIGSTNTFGSHKNNDFRFNFTQNASVLDSTSTSLGGAQPLDEKTLPGFSDAISGALTVEFLYGLYPDLSLSRAASGQTQYNFTDTFEWQHGRHSLRAGIDWRRLSTAFAPTTPIEDVLYSSANEVLSNTASTGVAISQPFGVVRPVYLNFSTFLQDEWTVNSRLSLSLGLRSDINPAPGDADGHSPYTLTQTSDLATAALAPRGTPLWRTDWHGLAPRLGFAYRLHQTPGHETVLRSGFGLFYDLGSALGSGGYSGIGYVAVAEYSNVPYPLTASQLNLPPPSVAAPYKGGVVYAFDPHLQLPYSMQYNLCIEQALSASQSLTLSYVGSTGRELLTNRLYYPNSLGNPNFAPSTAAYVTGSNASSAYNSFQAKYQRSITRGLQTLLSYTWAHSIDNASTNALLYYQLRGNSDFDIRHQLQAALTYDTPTSHANRLIGALASNWGFDLRLQTRSALPVNIESPAVIDPVTGVASEFQPNFVPNEPLYLRGSKYPGKRLINYAAFESAPPSVQGDVPRNVARGFDAVQGDLAVHRTFPIHERFNVQLRGEAFNVFNHPQFGAIYNDLSDGPALFGYAYNTLNGQLGGLNPLYQIGGPRSLQVMLRATF
jgi:hypothetical protein